MKTAGSNGNADTTINWAEGMPPASVNDSGRAMMARLAEYRDDVSGSLTTAGTSTAYTLTTNQGFASPPNNGQLVCFVPHVTNGAAPTLATDGGTAFPLQTSPGVAVISASLIQGTPYAASYNSSQGAWMMFGAGPAAIVPLGVALDYTGAAAPSSQWALAAGQAISRTTFAAYFSLVGTTYGAGDGSTTFNIPDLRGRTVFGVDNMGGSAANRITVAGGNFDGTVLGGNGGAQNHTLTTAELAAHNHTATSTVTDPGHTHTYTTTLSAGGATSSYSTNGTLSTPNTGSSVTGITVGTTTANAGSGNAHTILNPAIMLNKIIRVQ